MIDERDISVGEPGPASPPGITSSKSSKSSSFQSQHSDDTSVLDDVSHFEDIGLDDDATHHDSQHLRDTQIKPAPPNRYSPSYSSDLRVASLKNVGPGPGHWSQPPIRDLAKPRVKSDDASLPRSRPSFPSLQPHVRNLNARNARSTSLNVFPEPRRSPANLRGLASHSMISLPYSQRRRSPSPNLSLYPRDPNLPIKPRRSSWQSNTERKSSLELEKDCDDDDGDDIPDGLILDNVPISPRPQFERVGSRPPSSSTSPERAPKDRMRSVGNGTPPVARAQGSLRSPTSRSDSALGGVGEPPSPLKSRAKSWNAVLAGLNAEAKALTEKLEEHADIMEQQTRSANPNGRPNTWNSRSQSLDYPREPRQRVRSALPELPALRRTNIMIDPLPISKEKEAVLSRTRPSWLPPKDPAEERRHLREYQKMKAQSVQTDRRREAARRTQSASRDVNADRMMRTWEDDIIPRWADAVRERRTRELWWRGVASRSRGTVWSRAIGNELGLSETSYQAALTRAREVEDRVRAGMGDAEDIRRSAWFASIRKDVSEKTWKNLRIFQPEAPLHESLVEVLSAYAIYRSDIGYIGGCNTIAALLLLNLPTATAAFIALANVLNRPLPLSFYASDPGAKASAYNLVLQTLSHKSPTLYTHLTESISEANPDSYLSNVFIALGTGHLAMDESSRLWDVYVFEGDAILVRAAVALLIRREAALLRAQTAEELRTIMEISDTDGRQMVVEPGAEDRWMQSVREAGKT